VQARDGALLQPAITLWFDLPPETAAERLSGARVPDKFESQPVEFFRRVAAGYAERAAAAQRFVRIDANRSRDQVWQQIEAALTQRGLAGSKP
jgi:dTMP kinase